MPSPADESDEAADAQGRAAASPIPPSDRPEVPWVADVVAVEDGAAINVAVGLAVLAGIAAGDAICISATGERYSGSDHSAAAELLSRVDAKLGKRLRQLIDLKPGSHYGDTLLSAQDRIVALRAAATLVAAAMERVP